MREPDGLTGEYAIIVRSDWKGRGLGWRLMEAIIDHARATGLARIEGQVLAENAAMLAMNRELGFVIAPSAEEPEIKIVTLDLAK